MEIDDFQKFHEGIAGVMSFYGKSVSRFALDVWWTALRRFDLAAIVEAFNRHLANPDTGTVRAQAGRHHPHIAGFDAGFSPARMGQGRPGGTQHRDIQRRGIR